MRNDIVVGFDFSPLSELGIREAAAVAHRAPGTTVHVVTVVTDLATAASPSPELPEEMRRRVASALRALSAHAEVHVVAHVRAGVPAREILSLADDVQASNIIIGTHGREGVKRLVLGSVAETIVRKAHCKVTVMRPTHYEAHPELTPEPPCPACVASRTASEGAAPWCEQHARPWVPAHRYTYRGGDLHPYHSDGLGPT